MAEFRFQEPWVGSWSRDDFEVAHHEAGHAAIAWFHGLALLECRIDRPDSGLWGNVSVTPDLDKLEGHFQSIIAGQIASPLFLGGLFTWPLSPDAPGDEAAAAAVARRLDMTRAQFESHSAITRDLLVLFAEKRSRLVQALLDRGAIPGDEVHSILSGSKVPAADPERSRPVTSRQVGSTPVGVA